MNPKESYQVSNDQGVGILMVFLLLVICSVKNAESLYFGIYTKAFLPLHDMRRINELNKLLYGFPVNTGYCILEIGH